MPHLTKAHGDQLTCPGPPREALNAAHQPLPSPKRGPQRPRLALLRAETRCRTCCSLSRPVAWTHILLVVLHGAPHEGDDAHLVILALSVLQSQLVKKRKFSESARGIAGLAAVTFSLWLPCISSLPLCWHMQVSTPPSTPTRCASLWTRKGLLSVPGNLPFTMLTNPGVHPAPFLRLPLGPSLPCLALAQDSRGGRNNGGSRT